MSADTGRGGTDLAIQTEQPGPRHGDQETIGLQFLTGGPKTFGPRSLNLERWKAILAVASFLTDRGVTDLWDRVARLSRDYQGERQGFESGDLPALVVRALCVCVSGVTLVTLMTLV